MSKQNEPVKPGKELEHWLRADLTALVGNLEGQWLTIVDATFSDPQQRKAMKDIVRKMIWDWDIAILESMNVSQGMLASSDGSVLPDRA